MTQVTIVTGCSGAGKTETLLDHYRAALDRARSERRPGTTLWLTPTQRIQKFVTQQVLSRCESGCFIPSVLTFDRFAQKILTARQESSSPISPVVKRLVLRRIAQELKAKGELRYFESIAGSTGFLDVISSFVSELKREEIWPERFTEACFMRSAALARRDQEVALFYTRYQQHLTEQNWFDNEGRFWLARAALAAGARDPFANIRTLVVDGFADFTQTQYEILGHLAGWIDEITISLPVEQPLARHDLFVKPQAAIQNIRKYLPQDATVRVERLPATSDRRPNTPTNFKATNPLRWAKSIGVIADRLFSNPRFVQPSLEANGLEIIAATGSRGEWEAVAHRIKKMLSGADKRQTPTVANASSDSSPRSSGERQGEGSSSRFDSPLSSNVAHGDLAPQHSTVKPQEIVIGLRSVSDDGPRLRNYLASAGLPVWCEAKLPFTSSAVVRTLLSLLQLELEDWPFERLLAVMDSNFFQPTWRELKGGKAIRAVARLLRQLELDSGRDTILRVVAKHAAHEPSETPGRIDFLTDMARLASPLLARLSRTLDRLRRAHTLNDWADVLATIGEELGWSKPTSDGQSSTDSQELDLLQRILRTAAEADQKLSGNKRPPKLTLAEFTIELRDLLSHETLKSDPEPDGCIRILGIEQIRNLDVPHLFLIGLTENSFPSHRSDDCLFNESERRDFISRGVPLSHRSGHHADEMFLFYSIVTRARQSLTLSYPSVNSKGQPVFPSPYITALTSLFSPQNLVVTHEGNLNPVPATDRVLTLTDLRLAGMMEARHGHPELFRLVLEQEPLQKAMWNSLAACEMADQRFHQRGFTNYEGRLELPENLGRLRQRFGAHHQFSATELEAYATCPFRFWMSNVLKVDPVKPPEIGTDYLGRGNLLHTVLANLLMEGSLATPEALRNRFLELVGGHLDRQVSETDLQRALNGIERRILSKWADAFVQQQSEYDQRLADTLVLPKSLAPEIPFGRLPDAEVGSQDVHPAIQFGRDEKSVNVRGRIDRIDVGTFEGHPAYVVIDYKTGRRPRLNRDDLVAGHSIQLALYLLAIKRLNLAGANAIPFQMGYWTLKETGFKPGMTRAFERMAEAEIKSLEKILDDVLPRLAEGIRSGRFVVENSDKNCTGHCDFRTVCRVNQLRPLAESLGKRSPKPIDPTASDQIS